MSSSKREPAPKTSASFTSWKLRLLKAAGADPRIPPTYFRFLVRVVEALNEETRIAMIGDDVIADEVPGFGQQSTRNRARRALAELGYFSYEAGQGAKVTRYRISDEPVPAIMVAIEQARERRLAERKERRQAFRRDQSKHALVQGTASTQPCKSHPSKPAPMQGVHLQDTPSPRGYREEDETPGARARMPAGAHALACAQIRPRPLEDEWDDAIPEAPIPVRCNCGAPAICEAREFGSNRFAPFCEECRDDSILEELRPLKPEAQQPARMSYADASRGR
ncbi:hypothetical protein R1A27_14470 [Methylobacterium sp. NMS12]|uniref:hypothetical protein n=1 Tax=Methylobacterium sp. NMS12 TaxID=3079766 RepID=UPI003F8855BA